MGRRSYSLLAISVKRIEKERLLTQMCMSSEGRMNRKLLIVFASVKGHMGQVWAKLINIVGTSIIYNLPKCIWKTDFFSGDISD